MHCTPQNRVEDWKVLAIQQSEKHNETRSGSTFHVYGVRHSWPVFPSVLYYAAFEMKSKRQATVSTVHRWVKEPNAILKAKYCYLNKY